MRSGRDSTVLMESQIQCGAVNTTVDKATLTPDEEDMRRMGKKQEFRVSGTVFC